MNAPMSNRSEQDRGVAWIAGVGARAGLGAALGRRFARAGLTAVLSGRTEAQLERAADEIREAGGRAHVLVADVSRESEIVAAAARAGELGPLEVAVFNAAHGVRAPSLDLTAEQFEQAWRTSTLGGFLFGREALRSLLVQGRGSLLFTGATASLRGRPPFGAFAAAKAGLRSISQTFAREFGPRGIHVAHVVIDGGIDGERLRSNAPERVLAAGPDGLLDPDALAEVYFQLHAQPRSVWTQELDVRPFRESF
ncbi:MAG: short chain dehydrogenase family protein [Myxococcaceae bacterium]|nr:short chain dehydrogenase family protein [Myxococcaceae bacterium]